MMHKASALTRAAVVLAVLGAGSAAIASSPVDAGVGRAAQTCQVGGTYTRIRMLPAPMAVFGSLQANQTASFSAQATNGNLCVSGTVIYLILTNHVSGDSLIVQNPSQCGGATTIGSSFFVGCTTDATGKIPLTYKAPSTLPDTGVVQVIAQNQTSHASVSGHEWYLYQMDYQFSASPIAHSGTLAASQQVVDTLQAAGVGGAPQQNEPVYLSFTSTASPAGSAKVGTTTLTSSPTAFLTNTSGQIVITYTAPTTLPSSGIDTIHAGSNANSIPNVLNATSYAFAATAPMVSIGDLSQVEGDGAGPNDPKGKGTYAEFNVTLSAPSAVPVTVQYFTICGTGDKTCQEDYLQTSVSRPHTVTFAAGKTRAQINVTIYNYPAIEAYPETFFVQIENPTGGAVLGRSIGNGIIIQDDETTTAQLLYAGDTGVVRGTSGGNQFAEFTITLALNPSSNVTFNYATADGTAHAGVDYIATSGTATIVPGTTSAHIQVPILPTATPGATLTYTLTISNSSGATIDRAVGTGSIINWN
jgi:hypothetical protein